jgi:hypothetical protein
MAVWQLRSLMSIDTMQSVSSAQDIRQRNFRSALHALAGVLVIALAFLGFYLESARPYPNARSLYADCAAGGSEPDEAALVRRDRCRRYLGVMLDNWYLSQKSSMICSRYADGQLPGAYVAYWRQRGLGVFSEFFRSAESSAKEFLDSEAQPCPVPNPSLHPP